MRKRTTSCWGKVSGPVLTCSLLLLLLFSVCWGAQAQTKRQVSGKVSSQDGEQLPGVSVVVKNEAIGTVTDQEGNFTLSVPENAAALVFSFIGFVSQEIPISGD